MEKSVLQGISYLGFDKTLFVAVCGSSISKYQLNLLLDLGVQEICVAFDSDFEQIGDENWSKTVAKLYKINDKLKNYVNVSFLFDSTGQQLGFKQSPTDCGKNVFFNLWKNRIFI